MIKLYSYFRSSCSYRVRIALNLKGLNYQTLPIHLLRSGGEQFSSEYSKINAAHKVPTLVTDDGILSQSVAIIEYLENQFPEPALYPKDLYQLGLSRQLVEIINSDIQPLQNLSVLKKLVSDYGLSEQQKEDWIRHWIQLGFQSFETLLEKTSGKFSMGEHPGVVDCFLIPQVFNAHRFQLDMSAFPKISAINERCLSLEAFIKAAPANQPDSPLEKP